MGRLRFDTCVRNPCQRRLGQLGLIGRLGVAADFAQRRVAADGRDLAGTASGFGEPTTAGLRPSFKAEGLKTHPRGTKNCRALNLEAPFANLQRFGWFAGGLIRQYFGIFAQDILAIARLVRLARAPR